LKDEVKKLNFRDIVLDGEVCLMNNGKEDFKGIMKEIRRKDHTIQNLQRVDTLTLLASSVIPMGVMVVPEEGSREGMHKNRASAIIKEKP